MYHYIVFICRSTMMILFNLMSSLLLPSANATLLYASSSHSQLMLLIFLGNYYAGMNNRVITFPVAITGIRVKHIPDWKVCDLFKKRARADRQVFFALWRRELFPVMAPAAFCKEGESSHLPSVFLFFSMSRSLPV